MGTEVMTDLPPTEKSLQEETGRASTLQLKLGYYLVISNRNELSQGRKKRSIKRCIRQGSIKETKPAEDIY